MGRIGSRNEAGFVENFDRMGFDINKSGAELVSNSIDAKATHIIIKIVSNKWILFIDDGLGMTMQDIQNMFDAQRENHVDEQTIGVSGIGGKVSLFQLSKDDGGCPRTCQVLTRSEGNQYFKVVVPWNHIWKEKKYDKMISVHPMTTDDLHFFRSCMKTLHGTILCIPHSNSLETIIREQFKYKPSLDMIPYDARWSIIFGKLNVKILLDNNDGNSMTSLPLYDYMNQPRNVFYMEKLEMDVMVFRDRKGFVQYVIRNEDGEYVGFRMQGSSGRCDRNIRTISWDPRTSYIIGTLRIVMGMHQRDDIVQRVATVHPCAYDASFFEMETDLSRYVQFCTHIPMIRNGHYIKSYRFPDASHDVVYTKKSFDEWLENVYVRVEITYETSSSQKNALDAEMGIQQNKQQNDALLPKQLARLIAHLRHSYAQQVKAHIPQDWKHEDPSRTSEDIDSDTESSCEYLDPVDYYDCQHVMSESVDQQDVLSASKQYYEKAGQLIRTMLDSDAFHSTKGKELYDYVYHHFKEQI